MHFLKNFLFFLFLTSIVAEKSWKKRKNSARKMLIFKTTFFFRCTAHPQDEQSRNCRLKFYLWRHLTKKKNMKKAIELIFVSDVGHWQLKCSWCFQLFDFDCARHLKHVKKRKRIKTLKISKNDFWEKNEILKTSQSSRETSRK